MELHARSMPCACGAAYVYEACAWLTIVGLQTYHWVGTSLLAGGADGATA